MPDTLPQVIAVSAASGRLGRATLQALALQFPERRRVAIVRTPERLADLRDVEVRRGDYAAPDSMIEALRGVQALVLVSAPATGGTDRPALHANAIRAACAAGVRRVIYTSVIGNGRELETGFGPTQRDNRATEDVLAASGLEWIVARNGFYLDIDVQLMKAAAARDGVYESAAGAGRCNYISVAELGRATAALAAAARPAGRCYNLVGESIDMDSLARLVAEIFGLQLRYRAVEVEAALAKSLADPRIVARGGEPIARMLTGAQHAQRLGAFDVPSDYAAAAGRPCRSIREMLSEIARCA
ncbi:MAG: NAD(P)H-binding protein [Steroidobacteraceae bacterium]